MNKILSIALCCSFSLNAFAAKFEAMTEANSLGLNQHLISKLCNSLQASNNDCSVSAYKILSKKSTEKIENIVKQIIFATGNGYVEIVRASLLSKAQHSKAIFSALKLQQEVAGYNYDREDDNSTDVLRDAEQLDERFSNDVDNSNYLYLAGSISGAFGLDHSLLAIVDTKSGEVLIWNAGYSE